MTTVQLAHGVEVAEREIPFEGWRTVISTPTGRVALDDDQLAALAEWATTQIRRDDDR